MDTKKLLAFMLSAKEQGHSDEEIKSYILIRALANRGAPNGAGGVTPPEGIDNGEAMISQIMNFPTGKIPVTQRFGQKSPYDVFSGGINYGVDFGVGSGTPITAPDGNWEVVDAKGGASGKGYIGNKTNSGYGNTAVLRNTDTGESIRLSHLARLAVQAGQKVQGGQLVGLSGQTGNVTGPHLDVEYRNKTGKLADVTKSPYAAGLFTYKK